MLSLRPFSAFKSILFFGFGPSCSKLNKHKPLWIGYALDRKSKEVLAFNVGGTPQPEPPNTPEAAQP